LGAYPASNPSGYGTGSVTSVAATVPSFLSVAGSPITTSGTLAISYSGTALPIANGGTGQTSFTANYIPYGSFSSSASLQFDGTTMRVGSNALLGGTTNPIVGITGAANNYIQSYIYNATNGVSASSDFVAYSNNSTDAHGWADIGFTSQTYADTTYTVTGPNEAYVFGSAPSGAGATGNLVYATDSTGSANAHQWYVGGFTQAKSAWKMQLTSTGLQLANALSIANGGTGQTTAAAGFNALSPVTTTGDLIVGNGTNSATRLPIGTNGYVLTSNGTTAAWAASTGGGSSAYTRTSFTATAGQTAFTVTYSVGYLQVYVNGVLLATSDYTATSGTGFTLGVACAAGDVVEALVITTSVIANGISTGKSIAMAMIFGF
jgi:hypothetical protein